jgi:hypothetical protein
MPMALPSLRGRPPRLRANVQRTTVRAERSSRRASAFHGHPPRPFLAHLVRETRRPLRVRTERGPRLPGPMPAIRARKASHRQPQQHWALEDGSVANAPRPTLLDSGTARLASGTHKGGLSSLAMPIQPLWADALIDDVECWQTEHGFDTIESHKQGSSFWATCFPEFCEESCACQRPLSVPCYQAQMLASNLAKSLNFRFDS